MLFNNGRKKKDSNIRIDCVAGGILLNRYLAYCHETIFNTKGTPEENVPIKSRKYYKIQWKNIEHDLRKLFTNPLKIVPRIAYSLLAFFFIFQGKHEEAFNIAFLGSIAVDTAVETDVDGEPASISYTHPIGSGNNRFVFIGAGGLNEPNAPTWAAGATTNIINQVPLLTHYFVNPNLGDNTVALDGGNIKNLGSVSFTGVDQSGPIGASTSELDSASPNDMTLTTVENNSVRIDVMQAIKDDWSAVTTSLDSGVQRLGTDQVVQNQYNCQLIAYTNPQATAGADTHQWTTDATVRKYIAFEIKEAVVVSGQTIFGDEAFIS